MKYFLICNPGSQNGRSKSRFERIFTTLRSAGADFEYEVTADLDDARVKSEYANKQGYDVIAAVGGDGTINRVLNGFFDENGNQMSKAKLAVIYTGTSPDFCRSYNIPVRIEEAVSVMLKGSSGPVQCGKISYCSGPENSIPDTVSVFACCSNIGIGATLARLANNGIRKYIGDKAGTFISLLRALRTYRPVSLSLVRDGTEEILERVVNLSVGRTYYIASGIKIHNTLSSGDRLFYTVAVKKFSLLKIPGFFRAIYSGKPLPQNGIFTTETGSVIHISSPSDRPVEVEFDGDPAGYLPCCIEPCPSCVELITERQ
jgi:diacylglycerol kinase family enzyme